MAWQAQAEASPGLREPSPRLTASTGTSSCGAGRMHSTRPCQVNQNPAPKSPSGDNAKGSKRPLPRREWISSTLVRYLSQRRSWEQKAHIFRVPRKDQSADFPWHCNTQPRAAVHGASLGHRDAKPDIDLRRAGSHAAFSWVPVS